MLNLTSLRPLPSSPLVPSPALLSLPSSHLTKANLSGPLPGPQLAALTALTYL